MGTWLPQFSMSHMPNLSFISAPEIALLTLTKGDLLLQAGLSGAPQHLQALLVLKHVLFKVISLKCSIRLNNEAFKIGTLRRRQEVG